MKLRKSVILLAFALLLALNLALLVPCGKAEPPGYPSEPQHNPYVWIEDLDDDTEDYFEYPGETVQIWSYAGDAFIPYEIRVLRSTEGQSYNVPYTGPWISVKNITVTSAGWVQINHTDISSPGQTWWKVQIYKNDMEYPTSGTYFVIPEVPLGIAATLIACFAGFGVRRFRRIRKESR
jgi:hypothetical protein